MLNTIKDAKREIHGVCEAAEELKSYINDVDSLIDAADEVVQQAEEMEHPDHGAGFWISAKEYKDLQDAVRAVE